MSSFQIPDRGKNHGANWPKRGWEEQRLFRFDLGFLTQDQGEVLHGMAIILGRKIMSNVIGYLPEERDFYPKVTIQDQLLYFAELRGKSKKRD